MHPFIGVSAYPFQPKIGEPGRRAAKVPARSGDEPPPSVSNLVRTLDVLVVDDERTSRDGLAAAVRMFGHRCRTATDGFEALKAFEEKQPDVVISDWKMPGMNGAQLCERIRSTGDDAPYTYFIILSAFGDRDHLLAGMAAGADDYQQKPVDLDELEARLVSAARVVDLHRRTASRTEELRHDSTQFYKLSRTDALTGAGNRLRFDEEVAAMFSRAQRYRHRCALAICDLDFFKAFNDRFGHVAGDEALRQVADGMRASLRTADTVFRYGGEEFVVLLVEQSSEEAQIAMERMRAAVERLAIPSPATGGALTVSVGVAQVDTANDASPNEWLARADVALYEAKAQGRNRVVSTPCPKA